eukprot:Amastigsp_a342313_721.p3 type:complete len:121 gc:universal Amastigsp_a342313_721:143-505(+)
MPPPSLSTPALTSRRSSVAVVKSSVAPSSSKPTTRSTATPLMKQTIVGSVRTLSFATKNGVFVTSTLMNFVKKCRVASWSRCSCTIWQRANSGWKKCATTSLVLVTAARKSSSTQSVYTP